MRTFTYMTKLTSFLFGRKRPARLRPLRNRRLGLEQLEGRVTPAAYLVSVPGDLSGSNEGTGSLLSGDLRYCLNQAIVDPGIDTIDFDATVFATPQTITLASGLNTNPSNSTRYGPTSFVISGTANITITGSAAGVTLDGGDANRLFAITSGATLTLQNLTFQNGSATGTAGGLRAGGGAGMGGAVFVDGGNLTVTGSTFTNNTATGGSGGPGGDPTGAAGDGGGLGGGGVAGTFGTGGGKGGAGGLGGGGGGARFNFAGGMGGFGGGGGANGSGSLAPGAEGGFAGGAGSSDNQTTGMGGGGGLGGAIFNNQGTVNLINDTFTANTATAGAGFVNGMAYGGAVFTRNGTLNTTFVTFSLNTSADGGTDLFAVIDNSDGGNETSAGTAFLGMNLTNSIFGQSGVTSVSDFDIAIVLGNSLITGSNNLFSNTTQGFYFSSPVSGTDPLLGLLADNGGPTQTMAILPDSPVSNAGVTILGITTDQRGTAQNSPPDVGAYSNFAAGVIVVTPAAVSPGATTYGQAGTATTYVISGTLLTNDVSIVAPNGVELSADGGATYFTTLTLTPTTGTLADTTIYVRFSNLAVAGAFTGNIQNTSSGSTPQNVAVTGTINKAHLTVTANPDTRIYGDPDPKFTATISGFVNNDGVGSVSGSPSFSTPGANNATSPAGSTYDISVTQGSLEAANYDFTTFNTGVLTVTKAYLAVTANDNTRNYGAPDPTFAATITGFVNGETTAVVSGSPEFSTPSSNVVTSPAGSAYTIFVTQGTLAAANYDFISFKNGVLTVTQTPLLITADDKVKVVGDPIPPLTASYTGFVNGENASILTEQPTLSTTATSASPIGAYPITVTGGAADNYTISYADGTLMVTAVPIVMMGTSGDDQFIVRMKPGDSLTFQYSSNGGATFTDAPASGVGMVNVFGLGGNDNLIVDMTYGFIDGNPSELPLTFDGGDGIDYLVMQGDPAAGPLDEIFTASPSSSGAGILQLATTALSFAAPPSITISHVNTTGIQDTIPVTSLTINAGAMNNAIQIGAGPTIDSAASITTRGLDLNAVAAPDQKASYSTIGNGSFYNGNQGADKFDLTAQAFMSFTFANKTGVTINGDAGDDLFILDTTVPAAGLQSLTLDGGEGFDVLSAESLLVGGNVTQQNIDGVHTSQVDRFIARLYELRLGRNAADSEVAGWVTVAQTQGLTAVADGINASPEASNYLVKAWYRQYLGREAADSEAQGWGELITSNTITEEQAMQGILGSPEFFERAQTLFSVGAEDDRFIRALYQVVLHRAADEGGVAYWKSIYSTQGRNGVTNGFLTSVEFRSDLTAALYDNFLHRNAAQAEIDSWVYSSLDFRQMREGFLSSPEFEND